MKITSSNLLTIWSFLKSSYQQMKYTYIILGSLLLGCLGIGLTIHSRTSWLKDFSLDVASEIVGILLVVFSVDRVIEAERKKRKKKKEFVAVNQLKNAFVRHLYVLFEVTKKSSKTSPTALQSLFQNMQKPSLEEVITTIYKRPLKAESLDDILKFSSEIYRFRDLLNGILEKYSYILSAERIHTIEKTINAPLVLVLEQAQNTTLVESDQKQVLSSNLTQKDLQTIFEDYLSRLSQLIDICNQDLIEEIQIPNS